MPSSQPSPQHRKRPFDVVGFGLNSVDHICVVKHHPRLDSKQRLVTYDVQPGGQVPMEVGHFGVCADSPY